MKILGRDPATITGLIAALLGALGAFGLNLDDSLQSIIMAVVTAFLGLITAFQVGDGLVAAINGFAQSAISLFLYFGLDWSAENQAKVLFFISIAAGFWIRDKVTAPVPAEASLFGAPRSGKGTSVSA
jgi:hypothetical protein